MPKILYLVKSWGSDDHPFDSEKIWEAYRTIKEAKARCKQIEDQYTTDDNKVTAYWREIELRQFKIT